MQESALAENDIVELAHPKGFEPLTFASGGQRSIQLSYGWFWKDAKHTLVNFYSQSQLHFILQFSHYDTYHNQPSAQNRRRVAESNDVISSNTLRRRYNTFTGTIPLKIKNLTICEISPPYAIELCPLTHRW